MMMASWQTSIEKVSIGNIRIISLCLSMTCHTMRAAALVFFCVRPAAAGWTLTCSDGATTYEQGSDLLGDLKAMMDSTSDEAVVDCRIKSTHPPLATAAPLLEERPLPLSLSNGVGEPAPVQAKGAPPEVQSSQGP